MKVFISATQDDLRDYRDAVKDAVVESGYTAITIDSTQPTSVSRREILKLIDDSDVFLGIYAHRYGHMDRGDDISIPEQEFRRAAAKSKDILAFVIDPKRKWPQELVEDDFIKAERLERFKDELSSKWKAQTFKSPTNVVELMREPLQKLSEKHDRLQLLNEWSQGLTHRRKLNVISRLADANRENTLTDSAYRLCSQLIAGNFVTNGLEVSPRLIDLSEEVLKGTLDVDAYIQQANGLTPAFLNRFYRKYSLTILAFVAVVGLGLGYLAANYFMSRSDDPPIAALAVHSEHTEDDAEQVVSSEPQPEQPASEAPDEANSTNSQSEDKPLSNEANSTNSQSEGKPLLNEANSTNSQSEDKPLSNEANSTNSQSEGKPLSNEANSTNSQSEGKPLLNEANSTNSQSEVESVKENELDPQPPAVQTSNQPEPNIDPESVVASSTEQSSVLKEQITSVSVDTITLAQKIELWKAFVAAENLPASDKNYADKELAHLEALQSESFQIRIPDNFLLCKEVNPETRVPEDTSDVFSPGRIWMWARISTSQPDSVIAKWYSNGRLFYTRRAAIPVASSGYRVYFSHTHGDNRQGPNEVRLYTASDELIARRTFTITTN